MVHMYIYSYMFVLENTTNKEVANMNKIEKLVLYVDLLPLMFVMYGFIEYFIHT